MSRPTWVVKDLSDILGFDEATVKEAILPELESQTHQVRLQSHLQDFLGPSPKAKAFIDRYIALRFPSIPTPTPAPAPSLKPVPHPRSGQSTPATNAQSPAQITQALTDAFGPGGKVYQKNRTADEGNARAGGSGSHTPQFRHGGGLTIHDARPSSRNSGGDAKGKGAAGSGAKIWDLPTSKEVKRLEQVQELLQRVQGGGKAHREGKDSHVPDCFCQARIHALSPYTPHCAHCGLVICALHPPYIPCPSCVRPLHTSAQLARLIQRIAIEIDEQLSLEQAARDDVERERQARLIAESGGGAFPTLGGQSARPAPTAADGTRKVISIGSNPKGKGKGRATITTTTYKPSPPSTPAEVATPPAVDTISRPRSPPLEQSRVDKELGKVQKWRQEEDRPWGDLKADKKGDVWSYVELPVSHWVEEDGQGRRKLAKKKKKEGNLGVDGRVVPGAAVAA